jgi:hypothetical protein
VNYAVAADFTVLCANCHRMIHRSEDPSDLANFVSWFSQPNLESTIPSSAFAIARFADSQNDRLRNVAAQCLEDFITNTCGHRFSVHKGDMRLHWRK